MTSLNHWAWVGRAASLHISNMAHLAKREANDRVGHLAGLRCPLTSPVFPKRVTRGLGSMSKLTIRDKVWKASLQYFSRLGHVQNMWISEASSLLYLLQQGSTSGWKRDNLVLDIWVLCTTLNCNKLWWAQREVELINLKIVSHISSDKDRFRSWSHAILMLSSGACLMPCRLLQIKEIKPLWDGCKLRSASPMFTSGVWGKLDSEESVLFVDTWKSETLGNWTFQLVAQMIQIYYLWKDPWNTHYPVSAIPGMLGPVRKVEKYDWQKRDLRGKNQRSPSVSWTEPTPSMRAGWLDYLWVYLEGEEV